jgi:hypothetical protein
MKRLLQLLGAAVISYSVSGQDWVDALRFSEKFSGGTARSTAMGGAFGSLGADFASLSQNPAGLGLYRKSELIITPEVFHSRVNSTYLANQTHDTKYNFNVNSFGFVTAYKPRGDKFLKGVNFAIGYNKVNNFNSHIYIQGTNPQSSLADHYVQTANSYDTLDPFTDGLYYDAYVIDRDTVTGQYFIYNNKLPLPGIQQKTIDRSGRINEWNMALGFNFSNLIYIGGTFSFLPLRYTETSYYAEYNALIPNSQYFSQYEYTSTSGNGIEGKFGIIATPIPLIHIGVAFHTPVKYWLNYQYNTNLVSQFVNGVVQPLGYEDGVSYNYQLVTPYKAIGSLGFVFGKFGVLSADVEYVSYSTMHIKGGGDATYVDYVNQGIKDIYHNNFNFKTGAEVRLSMFYLRGGFGYYGSPYKSSEINKDAYHLNYSAGFGIRGKHAYIDFAWNYLLQKEKYILYNWTDVTANPNTEVFYTADLTHNEMMMLTTFGIRF